MGKGWSNDHELIWQPNHLGEMVELLVPSQKVGTYHLIVHYTKSPENGIFQATLNGTDLGVPVDLYSTNWTTTDAIDLGVVALTDAKPVFKATVTGQNPASKKFNFGLDYLKFVPAP